MFLNCALRLSELTSINVEQVTADSLRIIGKGNKERAIFLTPATKKAIADWLSVRGTVSTSALFISKNGERMTGRAVQDVVKKYLAKAGLDIKTLSTHKLRHTAATLMYQYGKVDIRALQQILGHDSIATTQIYTHAPANDTGTVIRFGKINCLIKERFAEQGKELDEILEKLIVDKCRQSA